MRTAKKVLSVFLVCVMMLCSAPLAGFVGLELPTVDFGKFFDVTADATEADSVLSCIKSFAIDKNCVVEGDMVNITMAAEGEYYPWFIVYNKPITKNTKQFSFEKISENTYLATMVIDNQTESGDWEVRAVAFRNADWDSVHVWNSANFDSPNFEKMDFSALDFEVNGTNADVTSPVLKNYSISSDTVAIGEAVEISLVIEEENPVDKLTMVYLIPSEEKKYVYLQKKEVSDSIVTYATTINITDDSPVGEWQPSHIFLEDSNDNGPIVYNTNVHSSGFVCIDLSKLNFKVVCTVHSDIDNDNYCDECKEYLSECIETGICGEKAAYKLYQDGTLIISGSGETTDYESGFSPFYNIDYTIRTIIIEDGITSIGDFLFECCNAQSIMICNSVEHIGNRAFSSSSIKTISIPNNVTSIGEYAFECCQNLSEIDISDNIDIISEGLFIGCANLNNILIPDKVESIEIGAFAGCSSLETIKISDSVKNICDGAFDQCYSLTDITIPINVVTIGKGAFSKCINLIRVNILNKNCNIYDASNTISDTATIYGKKNSTAQSYATKYSRAFIEYCLHENKEQHTATSPSCTEIGYTTGEYCPDCEIWLSGHEIINATNHINKEFHTQQNATCTENGYTAGEYCLDCEIWISGHEIINATNHINKIPYAQQDATCTESGFTAGEYCPDCEAWVSGHKTTEPTGHSYGQWIIDIEATETKVGIKHRECGCGDRITEEIPKLGTTITVLDSNIFCYEEYAKETYNQIRITDVDLFYVREDYTGKCAIPSEIDGCPVTSIEYEALANWDLSEVELIVPQSVTWIDGYSFVGTNAKSVTVLNPECEIYSSSVFSSCTIIIGYPNSEVHKYANNFNLTFKCIEHTWDVSYTVDKASTCTEDGLKSIHCTGCDEVKENTVMPATGHSWYNDENNIRICKICECSEDNPDATNLSYNRYKLFEQISAESNDGEKSCSFGNLSTNGYNYYFRATENSFFVQYKTKDSSWLKVIAFAYDYYSGIVTCDFSQSGSSNYYAATAIFNASDYIDVGSIVYTDATGSDYGGMCVTYAEKFAKTAIPKINQKMLSEFGISFYKIGFTSYSHTHTGGTATCYSYAICEICGKVYGSLENHMTEIKNQILATCYEAGYTGDVVCTICNEVVEYGSTIPMIEREEATGKFNLLKQYILNYGNSDTSDNKYVYYSDIVYNTNNDPVKVYAKITYLDEFAIFRLLYTSGEGEDLTSITMDIGENGSEVVIVEYSYEDLGLYANASVTVNNYSDSSNVFFELIQDFILSNDQIQNLCNSELRAAMVTWDILFLEHLQLNLNMGDLGFVSYEAPTSIPSKITSSKYSIIDNSINKIAVGTTVSTLLTGLNEGIYCKVYDKNTVVDGNSTVKTGMIVKIMDGNTEIASYLLIVTGDVDSDGQLTSSDARAALRAAVGLDTLTEEQKTAADADGDGNITSADARLILRAAVGLEDPTLWAEKIYNNI